MNGTMVDRLTTDIRDLIAILDHAGEYSLRSTADENLRKSLLLSAASYFEHRLSETIRSLVRKSTGNNNLVTSLVEQKAISRQYHTWFKWDGKNANTFFSLFGKEFSEHMKNKVKDDPELRMQLRRFSKLAMLEIFWCIEILAISL